MYNMYMVQDIYVHTHHTCKKDIYYNMVLIPTNWSSWLNSIILSGFLDDNYLVVLISTPNIKF